LTVHDHLSTFAQAVPVLDHGWSKDRKYRVVDNTGDNFLLRIHDIDNHEEQTKTFNFAKQAFTNGASVMQPYEIGLYDGKKEGYTVWEWVQGVELSVVSRTRYDLTAAVMGGKLGHILKKLHTVPYPDLTCVEYYKKELKELKKRGLFLKHEMDILFNYFNRHIKIFENRPLVFIHGDLLYSNIIITARGPVLIDFGYLTIGDPWDELCQYKWVEFDNDALALVIAAINAYNPASEFWIMQPFYYAIKLIKIAIRNKKKGKDISAVLVRLDAYCKILSASETPTAPDWFVSEDKLFYDVMEKNAGVNIFINDLSRIKLLKPMMYVLNFFKRLVKPFF